LLVKFQVNGKATTSQKISAGFLTNFCNSSITNSKKKLLTDNGTLAKNSSEA